MDKIEFLQSHENHDIYQKSFELIENYFGSEAEDARVAPLAVAAHAGDAADAHYAFGADHSVPWAATTSDCQLVSCTVPVL